MTEWGIFNDEASDWTAEEAVEAGFYSQADAEEAIRTCYEADDDLVAHQIEEETDKEE